MPTGYLVQTGDGVIDSSESIVDPSVAFTIDRVIGTGTWTVKGARGKTNLNNVVENGTYYLGTDGNVYFVPDNGPLTRFHSASVNSTPSADGIVHGSGSDDVIGTTYSDPEGDRIDDGIGTGTNGMGDLVEAGAGNDNVMSGLGDDTVSGDDGADTIDGGDGHDTLLGGAGADSIIAGLGNDTVEGGADNDWITGGGGADSLLGGDGNDTIYGGYEPFAGTGTGGSNAVSNSFQVISLGNRVDVDPTETNGISENAADLIGTYGSSGAPLYDSLADAVTNDVNLSTNVEDNDNGGTPEAMTINGATVFIDSVQVYNATLTFIDGTTAAIDAVVFQTTTGDTYFAPELALNADHTAMISAPIQSIELTSVFADDGALASDRMDANFQVAATDTSADHIDGGAGNDSLWGGDGADTIIGGLGSDELYGGLGDDELYLAEGDIADGEAGDDLFILTDLGEAGASTISILGGEIDEIGGDTLDLNGLADRSTLIYTNTDDAAGGLSGSVSMLDGTLVTFSEIENIICFTPGTRIMTETGERPIESLRTGDLIVTRDNGLQPLRWIGSRTVQGTGKFAPILIGKSLLPNAKRPLLVSPQHRMLIEDYQAELLFADREVLVSAKHMRNGRNVRQLPRDRVTYIHLMLDRHEIIFAEGTATESFHAGDLGISALSGASRDSMFAAFPGLRSEISSYGPTARRCLKRHEAQLLLNEIHASLAMAA